MTQGSSYPLAGIKIGQAPAHRLTTPTPTLASDVASTTPAAGAQDPSARSGTGHDDATGPVHKNIEAQDAPISGTKNPVRTTPEPTQDSNEVEVTTSDQISEHGLPTNGRSTHSSASSSASPSAGRSGVPDRRTAMGVASVRIAGRLTQNELGSRTGDIRTPDTSVGPDELLQLLGEYLVSGGLQNPEIHVRSNGQTIVLDLLNPAKGYR